MKNIILGLGGSGGRVVKPLMYFLASDKWSEPVNVQIILADNDEENAAITSCLELSSNYNDLKELFQIQEELYPELNPSKLTSFFKNNVSGIKVINSALKRNAVGIKQDTYIADVMMRSASLAQQSGRAKENKLLEYLCTDDEIKENIKNGFYGKPKLGAAAFDNSFYDELKDAINSEALNNQKVKFFIVGSLFGGTGAAAIPQIIDKLRSDTQNQVLRDAEITVLPLVPYYTINQDDGQPIDSATWRTKTKMALESYNIRYKETGNITFKTLEPNGTLPTFEFQLEGPKQDNTPCQYELDLAHLICNEIEDKSWPIPRENESFDDDYGLKSMCLLHKTISSNRLSFLKLDRPISKGRYDIDGGTKTSKNLETFLTSFANYMTKLLGEPGEKNTSRWYNGYRKESELLHIMPNKNLSLDSKELEISKLDFQFRKIHNSKLDLTQSDLLNALSKLFSLVQIKR